jgi:hypothetical protein
MVDLSTNELMIFFNCMEQNVFFTKFETIGTTKDEAMKNSNLNLRVDATQAYKKWAKENVTNEDNIKEWMIEYLKKKKFNMPNDGAYIVLQSAVLDSRERPYKVEKPKYEARTHTPVRVYVGRAQDTGEELFTEKTSKAAEQAAKEWVIDNHVGVDLVIETRLKEKNSLYAKVNYVPSKGTQKAKLLVFGYKVMD